MASDFEDMNMWIKTLARERPGINPADFETTPEIVYHASRVFSSIKHGRYDQERHVEYGPLVDYKKRINTVYVCELGGVITLDIDAVLACVDADDFPALVRLMARARVERLLQGD